ncbi:MAG: response regulator, partial [Proteobacteria bacterium]|nr:response regulator [Pseudomonadota bacterium]
LPLQGLHILVADDDIVSRMVAKRLLEHLGAQLTLAEDGLEALTLCQNTMFQAIIIDQSMPKLDGFTCAKEIKKLPGYEHIPTYVSTAAQIQELPDFIAGLLSKPISAAAVLRLFAWHTDKASLTDRDAQRPREDLELDAALTPGHTWLDHDHIIKNFGQVPALLGQCIPLVKSRYPILLENLNMALTLRHWPNLQAAAHELRGMLANLSCNKLANIAAKIEESCHSLAIELSSVCILHLEQSIPVFIEELESIVKATSNHPEQSSTSH